jgi:hypothetical protein
VDEGQPLTITIRDNALGMPTSLQRPARAANRGLWSLLAAITLLAATADGSQAGPGIDHRAPSARAKWVELRSASEERTVLLLRVRNFERGHGRFVEVFLNVGRSVIARPVNGSHKMWRVGPRDRASAHLIEEIVQHLDEKGVVTVKAGVLASAVGGGRLSSFRIKALNERFPALGPFATGG